MNEKQVSREQAEFKEWLEHPVTARLRKWAQEQRDNLKESWATGQFSDGFDVAMAVKNAGATGACSVYLEIVEMEFESLYGDSDGEHKRPGPEGAGSSGITLRAGD